ncbi:MAG: hypothetical protein DME04_10360 [Candidatus Rokuibacteriota bacterium]|nr:MAG: hypothetical protein DME04_10360 [Candidatus Rokubacteria bacterium]
MKFLAARTVVLAVLIGVASAATAPAQTQPTLGVLVDQLVALFPKVDGDVIEVQGTTVTVAIGRKDGLLAGVELALYRQGRELRHPKTGEVLGRTEQAVGRMVVQEVFEAYATGTLSQATEVQAGDKARVSAGKVKLSVLPIAEGGVKAGLVEAAVHELVEALNRTGRFQVGMGDAIGVWLTQQGIKRDDVLAGKGLAQVYERFRAEQLLVVAFTRVQNKPYMDVRLFTLPAVNSLLTTALFVPPAIKSAPKGDFSAGRPRDSQTPNPQRSLLARLLFGDLDAGTYSSGEAAITLKEVAKFPFVVTSMDVAVGSKDRIPRMVVTDGERIFLYRISAERALEPEWTYRGDARGRIFSVQLAELAEEGVVHVVANRYNPIPAILLNSFILASKDKKPVLVVEDVSDILLAMDTNGDGVKKALWMQSFAQTGFFKQGDAQRAVLRNGRLVVEQRVRVPSSFRATGATATNITGKGPRALAFVDEHNRLRIAIDTEEVFRSATQVGGGLTKLVVQTQIERGGRDYLYTTEPFPLSVDLDGDGIDEIVVPQNQFPGRLAVVYKGPAGYRFQTVNSGFEGTVIALGAIPGDSNTPSLIAAVVRFTNMFNTQGETQIIMTLVE